MPPVKRSAVWKYCMKQDTGTVLCKLCNKVFKFNSTSSSTSNIRCHLKAKHSLGDMLKDSNEDESAIAHISHSGGTIQESINNSTYRSGYISYEKVVLPKDRRSPYWKVFGFPATSEGEILSQEKVVCIICKSVLTFKGNTTNLKSHFEKRHSDKTIQPDTLQKVGEVTPRIIGPKTSKKRDSNVQLKNISGTFCFSEKVENSTEYVEESLDLGHSHSDPVSVNGDYIDNEHNVQDKNEANDMMVSDSQQPCSIQAFHPYTIPMEEKSVSDSVTEFIIMDIVPPDIVEGRGFQRLIASLKSPCEIPSKAKLVEEVIPRIYDSYKESVQDTLQLVTTDLVLSVEEWESNCGASYVTFSISYQQEKGESLVNKVLSSVHIPSSVDSSFWELVFDNLLDNWHLSLDHMTAVICASSQQPLINVFTHKGLIVIPCLIHTIQELCTKVCFNQEDVREIVTKCRAVVHTIYKHSNTLAALRIQDHLMMVEEMPLVADYPRLWVTTYNMLEALLARRQVVRTILDNMDSLPFSQDLVTISDDEWTLIEDVTTVLEPLKVTMMTLSEERIPLVSLLKPLLCQLINGHLKPKDEDSANVQVFKSALKTLLSERYSKSDVDQFLNISTTLDPRFKNLPNLANEAKACLDGPIRDKLVTLIEKRPKEVKPSPDEVPDKKKPKLLDVVIMLGEMCPEVRSSGSVSCQDRANLELVQYQSEEPATLDHCPTDWWSQMYIKCPNLSHLASTYTFVPAAATPPSRIALDTQLIYETRRANLSPEVTDRIIFLNSNQIA